MTDVGPGKDEPYRLLKNIGPTEPQIWGKLFPQNRYGFLGKYNFFRKNCKIKNIQSPIFHKKGCIQFCRQKPHSP